MAKDKVKDAVGIEAVDTRSDGTPQWSDAGRQDVVKPPKYASPVKADPQDADLPRICHPLTRAAAGQCRFKVSCHGHVKPAKYVLAKAGDVAGAKACYEKHMALAEERKGLPEGHIQPELIAVALAD